jgi:hypothetical protein
VNKGIEIALSEGYYYVCHLAHDDVWEANHLALINRIIEQYHPLFCCTLSTYLDGKVLPEIDVSNDIIPTYPLDGGMVASSTCVNYAETKLRVMDRLNVEGTMSPCDAYLWEQLRNELRAKKKTGYVATTITCHHDEEGSAIRQRSASLAQPVQPIQRRGAPAHIAPSFRRQLRKRRLRR